MLVIFFIIIKNISLLEIIYYIDYVVYIYLLISFNFWNVCDF